MRGAVRSCFTQYLLGTGIADAGGFQPSVARYPAFRLMAGSGGDCLLRFLLVGVGYTVRLVDGAFGTDAGVAGMAVRLVRPARTA